MHTDATATALVIDSIRGSGEMPADYPVGKIVEALHEYAETWDFDSIPTDVFWKIVERESTEDFDYRDNQYDQ